MVNGNKNMLMRITSFIVKKNTMPHKIPPYVGYTEFYPTTAYYFKSDFTFKIKSVHDIMEIGSREMD